MPSFPFFSVSRYPLCSLRAADLIPSPLSSAGIRHCPSHINSQAGLHYSPPHHIAGQLNQVYCPAPRQVKTAAAGSGAMHRLTVTDTECVFIDIAQTQTSLQLLYLQFKCGERGCQYRIISKYRPCSALNHLVNCTKAVISRLCHCNASCLPDIIIGLVIYC